MAWIKCKHINSRNFIGISVSLTGLSFSRKAYEALHQPERIDVFYDTKANAIKIEFNELGRKVSKNGTCYAFLPIKISDFMPLGKYEYIKDNIFVKIQ